MIDRDPGEAVRLIGLVPGRRPVDRVADFDVVCDMRVMLEVLRAKLGTEVADRILAAARTQALPDEVNWSTSSEAQRANAPARKRHVRHVSE